MSKSGVTVSNAEREEPSTASVFDFLYNDSRRIGSYLSQLDENGLLTEIRRGDQVAKNARRGFELGGTLFGTGATVAVAPGDAGGETSERVYDPFWANARELLDALDARGMIHRSIVDAPVGSLVLATGRLSIVDFMLFKSMWSLPAIRKLMTPAGNPSASEANRQMRRAESKPKPAATKPALSEEVTLMLEMLPIMPHSITATMDGTGTTVWATLKDEHLIATASDIVLKHGRAIPGEWLMLGVLDAHPDAGGEGDIHANSFEDFTNPARMSSQGIVGQFAQIMAPIIRLSLGRPATCYGMTPLLIFRQVGHAGI